MSNQQNAQKCMLNILEKTYDIVASMYTMIALLDAEAEDRSSTTRHVPLVEDSHTLGRSPESMGDRRNTDSLQSLESFEDDDQSHIICHTPDSVRSLESIENDDRSFAKDGILEPSLDSTQTSKNNSYSIESTVNSWRVRVSETSSAHDDTRVNEAAVALVEIYNESVIDARGQKRDRSDITGDLEEIHVKRRRGCVYQKVQNSS